MRVGMVPDRVRRVCAALAMLCLICGQGGARAETPPTATTSAATIPHAAEIEVKRGQQRVKVQPLATTKTNDGREALAGRIIVGFRGGTSEAEKAGVHSKVQSRGVSRAAAVAPIGPVTQLVDISGATSIDAALQVYRADPHVAYAEPDHLVHKADIPNDPDFTLQWGMSKVQAPAAWNVTHGMSGIAIAILDCGIYEQGSSTFAGPGGVIGHPDLSGKVTLRKDFTGSPHGTDDFCNHGTHVAGIAGADTNNGVGVAGVGYNTGLLNGKVLDDTGTGTESTVAQGIYWATDNGARVINLSLGETGSCASVSQDAINYAWSHNVVVVAAAGNGGSDAAFTPASCAHVVAVASTDSDDAKSNFSNYGPWVQVAAPGGHDASGHGILSTDDVGDYEYLQGTSMASPHVAGLAGLLWGTGQYAGAQAVVDRILATADPVPGTGSFWQAGRINAAAALGGSQPQITADRTSVPFGQNSVTLTFTTGGTPGQLFVAANGGPEALVANGAAGSVPFPFINSGVYIFRLYQGTAHTTLLASVTVTKLNPKGTTGPAILATPASFSFTTSTTALVRSATISFDTGDGSVGQVMLSVNGSAPQLFAAAQFGTSTAPWVFSGTYTFTLMKNGAVVDTATVKTTAQISTPNGTTAGGPSPNVTTAVGTPVALTFDTGSGQAAALCTQYGGLVSFSQNGAGVATSVDVAGAVMYSLHVGSCAGPLATPGTVAVTAT